MPLYTDFWQNLLGDLNRELDSNQPLEKSYHESGIEKIGQRKSYNGYLELFGCNVLSHTDSQVFRDLAEVFKKNGAIRSKLTGMLRVRVDKYMVVTFNY